MEVPLALILLTIIGMQSGSTTAEQKPELSQLVQVIRGNLRGADLLFRYEEHELVALLSQTDLITARQVAGRIEAAENAVRVASKTVNNITGVEVEHMTAKVEGGEIVSYKTTVKIAFGVGG